MSNPLLPLRYIAVIRYLMSFPSWLRKYFECKTNKEKLELEINLKIRDMDRLKRRAAYRYWYNHNMDLKYRRYSLRKLRTIVAIEQLRARNQYKDNEGWKSEE